MGTGLPRRTKVQRQPKQTVYRLDPAELAARDVHAAREWLGQQLAAAGVTLVYEVCRSGSALREKAEAELSQRMCEKLLAIERAVNDAQLFTRNFPVVGGAHLFPEIQEAFDMVTKAVWGLGFIWGRSGHCRIPSPQGRRGGSYTKAEINVQAAGLLDWLRFRLAGAEPTPTVAAIAAIAVVPKIDEPCTDQKGNSLADREDKWRKHIAKWRRGQAERLKSSREARFTA